MTETQGENIITKPVFPFTFFPVHSTFVEALTKVFFKRVSSFDGHLGNAFGLLFSSHACVSLTVLEYILEL